MCSCSQADLPDTTQQPVLHADVGDDTLLVHARWSARDGLSHAT